MALRKGFSGVAVNFIHNPLKGRTPTIARRTKFSDTFKEIYRWKNERNRPAQTGDEEFQQEMKDANLTLKTVYHLEQLSLVDFSDEAAIARLGSAIRYANRLKDVDVDGVEPLFSLMENETLRLRADEVTEGNDKESVLRNASVTMEDYFVAPPGNFPLAQSHKFGDASSEGDPGVMAGPKRTESSIEMKKARRKA